MKELLSKIDEAKQEFHRNTYFLADHIKCDFATRMKLSSLINEDNIIEDVNLRVIIDFDLPEGELRIGYGSGPTFSVINI